MIDSSDGIRRRVDEIIADLRTMGLGEVAGRFVQIQTMVYTTGSEWRAELSSAVNATRKHRAITPELDRKLRQLLRPGFSERVVRRQLWQGVRAGTILAMAGAAAVALATWDRMGRLAPLWIAGAVVLLALLWTSTRRVSACPGCGTSIRQRSARWCPYCATDLTTGVTGPRVAALPTTPGSTLLVCPSCGQAPGGRGRSGVHRPSAGHFCSSCGAKLTPG